MTTSYLTPGQIGVIEVLRYAGEPLTRANYIGVAWNDELSPAELDGEAEAELPDFLQGADDDRVFDYDKALAGEYDREEPDPLT
jgi:hypothetical protein